MLTGSSPMLPVTDVAATVTYFREVLGFPAGWVDSPPNIGGVSWGNASLFFVQSPEPLAISGYQHWFDVEDVDALYKTHQLAGAEILSPIEDKPWRRREYTVRDPNGFQLRFAGQPSHTSQGNGKLPTGLSLAVRKPTPDEHKRVCLAAFGSHEDVADSLHNAWGGVVAQAEDGESVGVLRINREASHWFSIWDVAVLPTYQGRRIGSELVTAALAHIREASPDSYVHLFTLSPEFYERLGFEQKRVCIRKV